VQRHTVYEGECMGLVLGLELLQGERDVMEVSIHMDSQVAICTVVGNRPGQDITSLMNSTNYNRS